MIIYDSNANSKPFQGRGHIYQNHFGSGNNQSRAVKVKTSPKKLCKVKKCKLNKNNIKYLKSLGLTVKVK